MENSIIIKVEKILDKQTFTSSKTGNVYEKFGFVGKTQAQFPKTVAFTVMGAEKFEKLYIVVGKTYNVSFDVESREWNGKYFTDITAWKAVCVDGDMGVTINRKRSSASASCTTTHAERKNLTIYRSDYAKFT